MLSRQHACCRVQMNSNVFSIVFSSVGAVLCVEQAACMLQSASEQYRVELCVEYCAEQCYVFSRQHACCTVQMNSILWSCVWTFI